MVVLVLPLLLLPFTAVFFSGSGSGGVAKLSVTSVVCPNTSMQSVYMCHSVRTCKNRLCISMNAQTILTLPEKVVCCNSPPSICVVVLFPSFFFA